ncbi:ABC transporter B family member 19 [Vigna angularis]|uniref:ABC transporter B family member 19 n=1 Tax=Phaseolus angularis TaxID=3914 RepID=A0A8T0JTS5_PHAAN|nr:ABC transporter B family member 19 [Vigna angularis]
MADAAEPKALPEAEKKKEQTLPFYKLFSFADKCDWMLMVSGSLGAIVHGSSMPVFFLLFGEMVNGFGKNQMDLKKMTEEVSKYALYFVYLGLVVCISSYAEIACWMYTGERQVSTLRKKYLEAVLKQDVGFFDTDARTGDIVFSVSTDTLLVQDAISEKGQLIHIHCHIADVAIPLWYKKRTYRNHGLPGLLIDIHRSGSIDDDGTRWRMLDANMHGFSHMVGNFIHYLSTFLAGLVVGFVSAWRLALLSVAVIPGIAFAGGLYAYTLTGLTSKSRESYANAGIIAEQAIAQVRTVYSYVGESKALNSYSDAIQNTLKLGYKAGMAKGLGLGCTYGIACMSWALVFWYAGVFIRNGQTDGGKAFTAIFSAIVGGMSLGQSFSNLGAFSKGKAAGYKLMEIIKQKPTIVEDPSEGKCLAEVNGNIEFKDVSFSYPSRPDVFIFRSQVLLDNVDIKTLQLKWLRDQIGLVNQEPALFATTILENILYGKADATMAEVEAATSAANAHSFITLLPNGYNTQVGERGVQLSGGQKQRIAIARAMLKNPKILLLDEATSALDAGSESIVQEALDRLMVGRTTVVVAHRLSTIRNVDTIAVIQQGQVVETGTHEELIAKAGTYASLIRFQEMVGNRDFSNPSTRRTRSSRLSHSLSTKSLSLRSGSLRNLSYQYSTGADGRIEMISNAETDKKNPAPDGYFFRLLKLNAPEWPYSIMGAVGSVLSGFIGPTFAIVMSNMIEVFYFRNYASMERKTKEYVFIYIGAGLYAVGAYLIQHYFFSIMGENLTTRVRRMMLAAILRNEVGWFDEEEHNSSLVAARLATDAADVKSAIAERISVILQNMTSLLTSFIVAFIVEWRVSLLILATFPLLVLANFAQIGPKFPNSTMTEIIMHVDDRGLNGATAALHFSELGGWGPLRIQVRFLNGTCTEACISFCCEVVVTNESYIFDHMQLSLKGFAGDTAKAHAKTSMIAGEGVSNIRTVAAFNAQTKMLSVFCNELRVPQRQSLRRSLTSGFLFGLSQLALYASEALILWYGAHLVSKGASTFSKVIKVFVVLVITANSVAETVSLAPEIIRGGEAVGSVFSILDRSTRIDPDDPDAEPVESLRGEIELRHVDFAYPSRPDVMVFKDLSLRIRAGQSQALVGASGSGKSSVIALIERFYDPIAGKVMVDGKDIRKLNLKSLRLKIGLVQQEPALFAASIFENIAYGKDGASESEVIEAARAANVHGFVSGLPEGYKTPVGERGVQLSGGQKQRIAIARAVLKDPTILLLDEATSALDAESECVLQEALERLMRGRTTVLVAHRLSTIRGVDCIGVVQDGRIVEQGSHAELVSRPEGAYSRLLQLQHHHI